MYFQSTTDNESFEIFAKEHLVNSTAIMDESPTLNTAEKNSKVFKL